MSSDEKGVLPVIGLILMVAITVILAAVIAEFVFGMSGNIAKVQNATPEQDNIIANVTDLYTDGSYYYVDADYKNSTWIIRSANNLVTLVTYRHLKIGTKYNFTLDYGWTDNYPRIIGIREV